MKDKNHKWCVPKNALKMKNTQTLDINCVIKMYMQKYIYQRHDLLNINHYPRFVFENLKTFRNKKLTQLYIIFWPKARVPNYFHHNSLYKVKNNVPTKVHTSRLPGTYSKVFSGWVMLKFCSQTWTNMNKIITHIIFIGWGNECKFIRTNCVFWNLN